MRTTIWFIDIKNHKLLTPDSNRSRHPPYTIGVHHTYLLVRVWLLVVASDFQGILKYYTNIARSHTYTHTQIYQGVLTIKLQGFHTFNLEVFAPKTLFPLVSRC